MLKDCLAAEETAFLRTVPMEFDSVLGLALDHIFRFQKCSECLQDSNSAGTIVVCTWSGQNRGQKQIDGVLMGALDDRVVRFAGYLRYYRELSPGVVKLLDCGAVFICACLFYLGLDLIIQPIGRLDAIRRFASWKAL